MAIPYTISSICKPQFSHFATFPIQNASKVSFLYEARGFCIAECIRLFHVIVEGKKGVPFASGVFLRRLMGTAKVAQSFTYGKCQCIYTMLPSFTGNTLYTEWAKLNDPTFSCSPTDTTYSVSNNVTLKSGLVQNTPLNCDVHD